MENAESMPDNGTHARNGDSSKGFSLKFNLAEMHSDRFLTVKPKELHFQSVLGKGAQATVFKALWVRTFAASTSSIVVAVKRLHSGLDPIYRDRESMTQLIDHPNLVKCFDSTDIPPYLVVTDFCAGGSLFDLLYNTKQELSLNQRLKILIDVATGMRYLQAQKPCILHRDLKSSNIMLAKPIRSTSQKPFAKVADFGHAREATSTRSYAMTVGVGTWRWMAPEVFDDDNHGCYDERADVYSFAIVMYEVLVRKIPYIDEFPSDTADARIGLHVLCGLRPNLDLLQGCPPELRRLMEQGWHNDAECRPDFVQTEEQLRKILATLCE